MELCHGKKSSNVKPILIQGSDDYDKTKERWNILNEYFKLNSIEYKKVSSVQGAILTKLINLIYFLDYTSIYKAILSETDPTPVKSIEFIKKKYNII